MLNRLLSLHKYWIHSNICYQNFKNYTSENIDLILDSLENLTPLKYHLLNLDHHGFYRSYWYSSLYVVIEGYKEINIKNDEIEELLKEEIFENKLRLFRNSIFHYQKEIYNHKFLGVDNSDEFVEWIYQIHRTFGKIIQEEMHKLIPKKDSEKIKANLEKINKDYEKQNNGS